MRSSYADMTLDELIAKREELRKSLLQLRFDKVVGHVANPLQIRTERRRYARVHSRIYEALQKIEREND